MINIFKEPLLSFLFPPLCPYCKSLKSSSLLFCEACLSVISFENEIIQYTKEKTPIVEGRCFEKSPPIENFYQTFLQDKHPKKQKLIADIALVQIKTLGFDNIDALISPSKRGGISKLVKNLSKTLDVPMLLEGTTISNKKVLSIFPSDVDLLFVINSHPTILYMLKFY